MRKIYLLAVSVFFGLVSQAQLVDPGFEGGIDASGWTQESTNFGTPLCDAMCGTCSGNCAPQAGSWYAWFGGAGPNTTEVAVLSQVVNIPAGNSASLTFYVKVATAGAGLSTERVDVVVDGVVKQTVTAAQSATYANYTLQTIDMTQYTGGSHIISLHGYSEQGTNILFDTFNLIVNGSSVVGVNELLNREEPVSIYPNPASERINVRFNLETQGVSHVRVYDLNGRLVNAETWPEVFNSTFSFDTNRLENGIYTVQVQNGANSYSERIVIAH